MARTASTDNVQADIRPPDYRGAVQLMRTIKPKRDKMSSVAGEISKIIAGVTGKKVSKLAATVFYKLDNLEPADRLDFFRSLNGMADAADWPDQGADMVDAAEGKVVDMRLHRGGAGPDDEGEEEENEDEDGIDEDPGSAASAAADRALDADDFEEASEDELAQQRGRREAAEAKGVRSKLDAGTGTTDEED